MSKRQRECSIKILEKFFTTKKAKSLEQIIYNSHKKIRENDEIAPKLYSEYAYQKIGELISHQKIIDKVVDDIGKLNVGWESIVFSEYRDRENKDRNAQTQIPEIKEGEFQCRDKKCGSKKCFYFSLQTRSSDEGSTIYVVCSKCGERYTLY